jgi:hypothetical protein
LAKNKDKASDDKAPSGRWRLLKGALVAVVTAVLGGGLVWGYYALRDRVRESPGYQITCENLTLVEAPVWMTEDIRAEIQMSRLDPDFPKRFSLLDEDVCQRVADAYAQCPWVERVEKVVKHDPRMDPRRILEISLKFRHPLAFVQVQENSLCLVDEQGVRLPGLYTAPRLGASTFIVITGVPWAAPDPGRKWNDESLAAGLKVAAAVEAKRKAFHLVSVDVSNFGYRQDRRETEVVLATAHNTRIKWGRAPTPQAELLQEESCAEKVAYLDLCYKSLHGQVDGVIEYIDIPNQAYYPRSRDVALRVRS